MTAHDDLPAYTVRVSQRARHVRLTVTPRHGLVVVVPRRWRGNTAAIVADKREWARHALAGIAEQRALFLGGAEAMLPSTIELRALSQTWPVEYRATPAAGVRAREAGGALVVSGHVEDADACLGALVRWLDRTSRTHLPPMLAQTSHECGVAYVSARVRCQRSRWGSCSSRRTISLNRNLIFLPEHLVRALMLHELAHTIVLDHSSRFWAALESIDPAFASCRLELKRAGILVPPWAEA